MPELTPDGMPDVHEGVLDAAFVQRLLGDLEACAHVHSITIKRAPEQHAEPDPLDLPSAARALFDGNARAIQVRYRHQNQEWTDTIIRSGDAFRLIRVAALTA